MGSIGDEVKFVKTFTDIEKRTTSLRILEALTFATPVRLHGGGRARASWNLSSGEPDLRVPDGIERVGGGPEVANIPAEGKPMFIASALSYMPVLAQGRHFNPVMNRWQGSDQQPMDGWVEREADRVAIETREALIPSRR